MSKFDFFMVVLGYTVFYGFLGTIFFTGLYTIVNRLFFEKKKKEE